MKQKTMYRPRLLLQQQVIPTVCIIGILQIMVVVNGQNATIPPHPNFNNLNRNWDRFNYVATTTQYDTHYDFGPEDWEFVSCPDLLTCEGWSDKYEYGKGWDLYQGGNCLWCPVGDDRCGSHHESPINLERARAIRTDAEYNACIDVHWMQYHDSACTFDQLKQQNGFRIERHALKIVQPIVLNSTGYYVLNCFDKGKSWGRIDFSRGFSAWWYLSHTDVHVPSEHTQEGKRYDAELQMYHFYSKSGEDAGVDNEMGTLLIFLQAYDNAGDYAVLNKLICAWRETEQQTRSQCGLESVSSEYPGCLRYNDNTNDGFTSPQEQTRNLLRRYPSVTTEEAEELLRDSIPYDPESSSSSRSDRPPLQRAVSAYDIMLENDVQLFSNKTFDPMIIGLDKEHHIVDRDSIDWDAFIAEQYAKDAIDHHGRELLNYDHVEWHNYFAMLGVRTEYYYRYSGTQTIPPCHGRFKQGQSRTNTNHWRVMKDPIRISKRQLVELHRLLRERIAPLDDPINPCQPDTAAKVDPNTGFVDVTRPLQQPSIPHYSVFCECNNWESKWYEDQQWCLEPEQLVRFYDKPYNFPSEGF